MNDHKCTHPDHNDNETCEDRAVACNANCRCCLVLDDHKDAKWCPKTEMYEDEVFILEFGSQNGPA